MTRLQKLLSQIKTVEELAEILGVSPFYIYKRITVSKDREQLIPCKCENCEKCALHYSGRCTSRYESMVKYFNAEISSHTPSTKVIELRENARKVFKFFIEKSLQTSSCLTIAKLLDEYCDLLELIGLFEVNECHQQVLEIAKEITKK